MQAHFRHHARFYATAALGLLVGILLAARGSKFALVAGGDVFFASYLVSAAFVALRATPNGLRKYASYDDEGVGLIFLLTIGAIGVSLVAIFLLIKQTDQPRDPLHLAVALAAVPLGWLTLHTLLAFRYAHVYYMPARPPSSGDARGLEFHGEAEPAALDFLYHSLVIGMTGGVSDVEVHSTHMRRLATVHGVASFYFNTVILALAINVAASLG